MNKEEMVKEVFIKLMDRIEVQSELVNSWTKHLITTQSALALGLGFLLNLSATHNSEVKIFYVIFLAAIAIISARILTNIIIRQLQWEGEYIRQIRKLEDNNVPVIFENTGINIETKPFEGRGFIANQISFFFCIILLAWLSIAFVQIAYML